MIYNTMLNMRILEFSLKTRIKYFIWISSMTGYPNMDNPSEKDYFIGEPSTIYNSVGWMSRYFEKSLNLFSKRENMNVLIIRPTAIYGKYDDFNYETCHALPALIRRVAERHPSVEIWGSGEDERDWLYIDDLIDACFLALEKFEGYKVVNVGSGKSCSMNQLLNYLFEIENNSEAELFHNKRKRM